MPLSLLLSYMYYNKATKVYVYYIYTRSQKIIFGGLKVILLDRWVGLGALKGLANCLIWDEQIFKKTKI